MTTKPTVKYQTLLIQYSLKQVFSKCAELASGFVRKIEENIIEPFSTIHKTKIS